MKAFLYTLLTLVLASPPVLAQTFEFTFNRNDFEISISDNVAEIHSKSSDYFTTSNPTGPVLPVMMKKVLNPSGHSVSDVEIKVSKTLIASDVYMEACGEFTTTDAPVAVEVKEPGFATASETDAVSLMSGESDLNGFSFSYYSLKPFLYDAESRNLYFVSSVSFSPVFESRKSRSTDSGSTKILRPEMVDFSDALNDSAIESYQQTITASRAVQQQNETIDYLIVTRYDLVGDFSEFVKWKRQKGLNVKVVTLDEIDLLYPEIGNRPLRIKTYINKLYKENNLTYVLLGGTPLIVDRVPCTINMQGHEASDGKLDSDTYYSCLSDGYSFDWDGIRDHTNGSIDNIDLGPDIFLGRLLANDPVEVGIACKKIIDYEKGSFPDDRINKILLGGAAGEEDGDNPKEGEKSYRHKRGETTDRLYLKPYGLQATYIFDTTESPKFTSDELVSEMNKNYHFINTDCHGMADGWLCCKRDEDEEKDYFTNDNIRSLSNIPAIVTTTACHTNDFRSDTKSIAPNGSRLSYIMVSHEDNGCVAYISSSGLGWKIGGSAEIAYSSLYNAMFYKTLFSYSERSHGNVLSRIHNRVITDLVKIKDQNRPSVQGIYRYLFLGINVSGDPSMTLFTESPKTIATPSMTWTEDGLRVSNVPTGLMVSVNAVDDETTCLGKCVSTGEVVFPNINRPCILTITGVNYRPYQYHIKNYPVLILENMTITDDLEYTANRIYLGKNVTLRSGVTLKLNYRESLKVRDNVNCNARSKLIINQKK